MNQSFSYNGPKSLTEDRDCGLCATVARKKCPEHVIPELGCSHCDAVKSGLCPSHCGIENAVKVAKLDPALSAFILAEAGKMPEGAMRVHARTHDADGDDALEYGVSIEIALRPS